MLDYDRASTNLLLATRNADPRSRVLDRTALLGALDEAVDAGSSPSILAIFGFEGLSEYLEAASSDAGVTLLEDLAACLVSAVGGVGGLFVSRRGEFCGLFDGELAAVRPLLVRIPAALDHMARPFMVRCSQGITVLPDEATDPTHALSLADGWLRDFSGNLRPRGLGSDTA